MSARFRITVDVEDSDADLMQKTMQFYAERLRARLTRVDYVDHADYRVEIRRRTLRKIGRSSK